MGTHFHIHMGAVFFPADYERGGVFVYRLAGGAGLSADDLAFQQSAEKSCPTKAGCEIRRAVFSAKCVVRICRAALHVRI